MVPKVSNLKLKNVSSYDDSSDDEDENKVTGNSDLYLPLEKLNLGPKKKLLVLSLGGLLLDRVHRSKVSTVRRYTPDFEHGNFLVFKRPFCDQFLNFCLERFEVGMWSSAMEHNVTPILDEIMVDLRHKVLFIWGQNKCIDSGFSSVEKNNKPIFLKQLKIIWENKYGIRTLLGGRFSKSNTLMIVDEPHSALLNPPNTAIFPRPYKVINDRNDNFLGPSGKMQEFLEGLANANDVPTYVKEHPLGQPEITESHSNWDYYVKVIRSVKC